MTGWVRGLRVMVVAIFAAALAAGVAGSASAADCPSSDQSGAPSRFVALINSERASHGLQSLSTHGEIGSVAQSHAQTMAAGGTIFHNTAYMGMIDSLGATMLAENVGVGCSVDSIHAAFMNSPTHKDNILTGALTHVGLGTATDGLGRLYVVEAFAAFPAAPAAAPVAPKPAEPAPAPDRVPAKASASEPPAPIPAEAAQPVPAVAEAPEPPATAAPATPPAMARTQPMPAGATLEATTTMPASSTGRLPVETGAVTAAFVAAGMAYLFLRRPALEPAWEAAAMTLRAQPWPAWDAVRS